MMGEIERIVPIGVPKPISDSGYGSNKSNSNSQSQRSSGSSKSQRSSLSSEGHEHGDVKEKCIGKQRQEKPGCEETVVMATLSEENQKMQMNLKWSEVFADEFSATVTNSSVKAGFVAAVSLDDGLLVYYGETAEISNCREACIGKHFIDFVHPKDRMSFAGQVTASGQSLELYHCRVRNPVVAQAPYLIFEMTIKVKQVEFGNRTGKHSGCQGDGTHLIIGAMPVKSKFEYPEECLTNPSNFTTRHLASCTVADFDPVGISYLGYLPQDVIGSSILDYYHPEDMNNLKQIYEEVMLQQGRPFRSKPYRFRVFNGTFAWLETDWSCFINPWSWKLEFVIGQHRVIKGPSNPNVFTQAQKDEQTEISEDASEDWKVVQGQIKIILSETLSQRSSWYPKRHGATTWRRRKSLGTQLDSVFDQMPKSSRASINSDCSDTFSLLAKDTVMLGEISPYHDHDEDQSGSNESSETPPSYGQLNYRENIERFFHSHPKTAHSNDSGDKMETNRSSSDDDSKISPCPDYSSGSNNGNWSGSNGSGGDCDGDANLTEDLLLRHNEIMAKCLTQWHKERRVKTKHHKDTNSNPKAKRVAGWPAEPSKPSKVAHLDDYVRPIVGHSPHAACLSFQASFKSGTPATPQSSVVPYLTSTLRSSPNAMLYHDQAATAEPGIRRDDVTKRSGGGGGIPLRLLSPGSGMFNSQRCNTLLPKCYKSAAFLEKMTSYFQYPLISQGKFVISHSVSRSLEGGGGGGGQKVNHITPVEQRTKSTTASTSKSHSQTEESCSSSLYSLLKTDTTVSFESNHDNRILNPEQIPIPFLIPSSPQLEITPEILLRYQCPQNEEDSTDLLSKELNALEFIGGISTTLNHQLTQLYNEMRSDNRLPHALLEDEGTTSSGNESLNSETKSMKRFFFDPTIRSFDSM